MASPTLCGMASNPSPRWTPTLVGVGAVLRAARQ
jgi:hypothetical protein